MPKIFVYGTLLKGLENHRLLKDETLLYSGLTCDSLFVVANRSHLFNKPDAAANVKSYDPTLQLEPQDAYPYPFMTREGLVENHYSSRIIGEVYEVSDATLERLDILEDHPRSYKRQSIDIENLETRETSPVDCYLLHSETLLQDIKSSVVANLADPENTNCEYDLLLEKHQGSWMKYIQKD
jgi:gamma-glutamylcyclotransferase (GGCT)/AIG2-like uncharacterized protein YtfP